MEGTITRPVYVVGQRMACYHRGTPALVVGLKMVTPKGCSEQPCLHIKFLNGNEDYILLREVGTEKDAIYRLLSPDEVEFKVAHSERV